MSIVVDENTNEKDMRDSILLLETTTNYKDWHYDEGVGVFLSETMAQLTRDNGYCDYWAVPDPILSSCSFYVGYWCGKDNDLICVAPMPFQETKELDPYLSPQGGTPMEAIRKTIEKWV